MFKIDKKTNKISITKGDNAGIIVSLVDVDGKKRSVFEDDKIEITVRKNTNSEVLINKTAIGNRIYFDPIDTSNLPVGLYLYDIQLTTFDKKIYTVVPMSYFEVKEEITR